ncbi:MAG: hypothetical protein D3923_14225, partial [Candidatus Electrothrix sp. AR3]|nr:hypothetical protein [Candidatus Electrothrix sp. AR3]
SRAVAAPAVFLPLVEATASNATKVILMQTDRHDWKNSGQEGNWELLDERKFTLPFSAHKRSLLMVRRRQEVK